MAHPRPSIATDLLIHDAEHRVRSEIENQNRMGEQRVTTRPPSPYSAKRSFCAGTVLTFGFE
jgi:hypothetical protein